MSPPNAEKFSYKLFDVSVEQNWIDFAKYLEDNDLFSFAKNLLEKFFVSGIIKLSKAECFR